MRVFINKRVRYGKKAPVRVTVHAELPSLVVKLPREEAEDVNRLAPVRALAVVS